MSEKKAMHQDNKGSWGGPRTAGPGKKLGRDKILDEYIRRQFSIDRKTDDKLNEIAQSVDGSNRSAVIRHLVEHADIILARYPFEG